MPGKEGNAESKDNQNKDKENPGKGNSKVSLLSRSDNDLLKLESNYLTYNSGSQFNFLAAKGGGGGGNSGGGGGNSGSGGNSGNSGNQGQGNDKDNPGKGNDKDNPGKGQDKENQENQENQGKGQDKHKDHPGKGWGKDKEHPGRGWGKGGKWRNLQLQQLQLNEDGIELPAYLMEPTSMASYSYDEVGNRTSMTTDQGTVAYIYNEANSLLAAGDNSYYYDDNGNLIFKIDENGSGTEYEYNAANKMVAVYFEDGTDLNYAYDGYGRKILREETYWQKEAAKPSNKGNAQGKGKGIDKGEESGESSDTVSAQLRTETTSYLYDGKKLLKEYTGNLSPLAEYQIGPDGVIARNMFGYHGRKEQGAPDLQTRGGLMYYHYDALGNVTDLTDRIGETITQFRFDAFGGMYAGTLAPYNFMGLTGKDYDPKSGLIDFSFRWYDPQVGRFTQPDSFKGSIGNPMTQHPFAYVGNNPINYTDPTGHYTDPGGNYTYISDDEYEDLADLLDVPTDDPGIPWKDVVDFILDDLYNSGSGGGGGSSSGSGGSGDSSWDDDDDYSYSEPPPTPAQKHAQFNQAAPAGPVVVAMSSSNSIIENNGSRNTLTPYEIELREEFNNATNMIQKGTAIGKAIIYSWSERYSNANDIYVNNLVAAGVEKEIAEEAFSYSAAYLLYSIVSGAINTVDNSERFFSNEGSTPSVNQPKPPGWDNDWEWRYPEGDSISEPRWFDPEGGEWRYHAPDKWHPDGHWDYNPWDQWNTPWQNIYK